MSIPAGYSVDDNGFYYYTDGSGPYAISSDGVPSLLAGDQVSVTKVGFTRAPNGLYYGTSGDGPYASDGTRIFMLSV